MNDVNRGGQHDDQSPTVESDEAEVAAPQTRRARLKAKIASQAHMIATLREREQALARKLEAARTRIDALNAKQAAMKAEVRELRAESSAQAAAREAGAEMSGSGALLPRTPASFQGGTDAGGRLAAMTEKAAGLQAKLQRQRELRAVDREKHVRQVERLRQAQLRNEQMRDSRVEFQQKHRLAYPTSRLSEFAECALARSVEIAADAYVTVTEMPLLAAHAVAQKVGGRVYCDVVEHPQIELRSIAPNWTPQMLLYYNYAHREMIARADGLLTVSQALAEYLAPSGTPVTFMPNYRWRSEAPSRNDYLRELAGLGPDARIVLSVGHVVKNFRTLVRSLKALPDDVHLVCLSRIAPQDYFDACMAMVGEEGLSDRVRLLDYVPYDDLQRAISGADVGVVLFDPNIGNHAVGLPNRVFDFISAETPFCALDIPDIAGIIRDYGLGEVVPESTPAAWANAIIRVLDEGRADLEKLVRAREAMVWEKLETPLYEALGRPRSVTFMGLRDLTGYNRSQRMAASLLGMGVDVNFLTVTTPERLEIEHPLMDAGLRYHLLTI